MVLIPYSKKAHFYHKRQQQPSKFEKGSLRTVEFHKVPYGGKKYKKYHKKGSGAKAIRGKKKKSGRWETQSILIPKKKKK